MPTLKLDTYDLETVRTILRTHLPGMEVWAFGSRVHGENLKPHSDLDLVVITESPLNALKLAGVKDAFSESALPFKVDVLDWTTTNQRFRDIIRRDYIRIQ